MPKASLSTGQAKFYVTSLGDYQVSSGVRTYKPDGTQTVPTITAGLILPETFAVTAGKIYIGDVDNSIVSAYNPDGTPTTPTITGGFVDPTGIAVDTAGKIYVARHP